MKSEMKDNLRLAVLGIRKDTRIIVSSDNV